MFSTLLAVIVALAIGHVAPAAVAQLRRFAWLDGWAGWLAGQGGLARAWRGRWGAALALVPPLLLVALLQWGLHGPWLGLLSLLFAVAVLVYSWGPRDLDADVEAVVEAGDEALRRAAAAALSVDGQLPATDAPALVAATAASAQRRWFAVLFWFLLLGPVGALGYRLVARLAWGGTSATLAPAARDGVRRLLAGLDWPVARLMALSMALAGNYDAVFGAWRGAGGNRWTGDQGFLATVAQAAVNAELREDEAEGTALVPAHRRLPELHDLMNLLWRMLLLWLAVLALFVIAGWVG